MILPRASTHARLDSSFCVSLSLHVKGGPKKRGHRLMTIILPNINRDFNFFFTGRFLSKFAVKWILKPHRTLLVLLHYRVNINVSKTSN